MPETRVTAGFPLSCLRVGIDGLQPKVLLPLYTCTVPCKNTTVMIELIAAFQ
jgi:hypothetical protein